jgi:hypothetical protein
VFVLGEFSSLVYYLPTYPSGASYSDSLFGKTCKYVRNFKGTNALAYFVTPSVTFMAAPSGNE